MAEEQTGTEQTGDADQTKETSTVDKKEEYEGMKQAYSAEKEKRQEAEAANQVLQDQAAVAAANPPPVQESKGPVSSYEQALTETGLRDEPYPSPEQRIKIESRKEEIDRARNMNAIAQMSGNQFVASHPDFNEVVGMNHPVTGVFMPSKEVNEILMKEPHLRASIISGPESAWKIVMKHREQAENDAKFATLQEHTDAQAIDDNLKPMSPGSKGGSGDRDLSKSLKTVEDVRRMEADVAAGLYD